MMFYISTTVTAVLLAMIVYIVLVILGACCKITEMKNCSQIVRGMFVCGCLIGILYFCIRIIIHLI